MTPKKLVIIALGIISIISLAGCGPETIWLRPGLDTPSQHISNGQQFMSRGKYEDALREFNRAKELEPDSVDAYIGIGLVMGKRGEINAGLERLKQAETLADTPEEKRSVNRAYKRFHDDTGH